MYISYLKLNTKKYFSCYAASLHVTSGLMPSIGQLMYKSQFYLQRYYCTFL